jgi:hypothetical protein
MTGEIIFQSIKEKDPETEKVLAKTEWTYEVGTGLIPCL